MAARRKEERRRMEPIRLVCRCSEEVGSFKVRAHILPMGDSEHERTCPVDRERSIVISQHEEASFDERLEETHRHGVM